MMKHTKLSGQSNSLVRLFVSNLLNCHFLRRRPPFLPPVADVQMLMWECWGSGYTNTIGTIAYSCAAVTIQSSTGTVNATTFSGALSGNATTATYLKSPFPYNNNNRCICRV